MPVYFDNALGRPLTIQVDGAQHPLAGRRSLVLKLTPGPHHFVLRDGSRQLDTLDVVIHKQTFADALFAPRFFIYNALGAGIYETGRFVYSTIPAERTSEQHLLALERWIEQPQPDYLFRDPPSSVNSSRASATTFDIADGVGYRQLASAWYREGRFDDAARAVVKGLETNRCDSGLRTDLVTILDTSDQGARALSASREWMTRCPDEILAHRTYQNLNMSADSRAALIAEYRERLERNPTAANHYLYGRLLNGREALNAFQEALRLDSKLNWARVALGMELLRAERDQEAFATLAESLQGGELLESAPQTFAMAAVATNRIDEAVALLARSVDAERAWVASWTLTRAKGDWAQARVLLAQYEADQPTVETTIMRARLEWEAGGTRASILADLNNQPATREAARVLTLEDRLENGAFREAAQITNVPELYVVYAAHAALLDGAAANPRLADPFHDALVKAARGEIDETRLLAIADDVGIGMRMHAFFALAVRAATLGDRATAARYFRKSAARAFTRDFPYGVALENAKRFEAAPTPPPSPSIAPAPRPSVSK